MTMRASAARNQMRAGAAVGLLDLYGVGVHAHVQASVEEPEDQERAAERPGVVRESGQHEGGGAQGARRGHHGPGAEPVRQRTGQLHAGESTPAEDHEESAEHGVADADPRLDRRDLHHPDAQQGAVQHEVHEGRHSGGAERSVHHAPTVSNILNVRKLRILTS
jgi:hypothetical protein